MIIEIKENEHTYSFDISKPIDISIPIKHDKNPSVWGAPNVVLEPVKQGNYVGSISQGSSVNFYTLQITPHGNGTHTECIGHIIEGGYTIHQSLQQSLFLAQLITVQPVKQGSNLVITKTLIEEKTKNQNGINKALIINTLPNNDDKKSKAYLGTNPPYFNPEAIEYINDLGIEHLLTDLPSVDPEQDGGNLLAHKSFWYKNQIPQTQKTITELIYVPDSVSEGLYLLQLGIISLESDASPSKPLIYKCL